MLDVGFSEILLTSAIALIVLGPERLPKVARQVGNWMGRARAMARQLSEQLEREVSAEELLKAQNKPAPGFTPSIAPPTAAAPGAVEPAEPVYGRDASFTTPAAMHAADRLADSKPPHE
jgi:Tat protein translocase TatB subunit